MVISNPAQPSNANEATTDDQAKGGLFTDTNGVGLDLSGLIGPEGPAGPQGPAGPTGPQGERGLQGNPGNDGSNGFSVTRLTANPDSAARTTTLMFFVGVAGGGDTEIQVPVVVPWGEDGDAHAANFSRDVTVTTLPFGTAATAGITGTGIDTDPWILSLGIPAGRDGTDGDPGEDGDTFIPVFFNPAGTAATWDATTTLAQGSTFFSYVPLSNTDVFTRGTIDSFDAERFRTFEQNGHFGRHTLGGVEGDSVSGIRIINPSSVATGTRYTLEVDVSNAAGSVVDMFRANFIAPEGPGGTGSGDTFQSDDGSIDIQEVSNNVFSFTVPQLGNAMRYGVLISLPYQRMQASS